MLLSLLHRRRKWAVVSGSDPHSGQVSLHFFPAVLDVERGYLFIRSWAFTVAFRMSSWDTVFFKTGCSFPTWHASTLRNSMVDIVLASSLNSFSQWFHTAHVRSSSTASCLGYFLKVSTRWVGCMFAEVFSPLISSWMIHHPS